MCKAEWRISESEKKSYSYQVGMKNFEPVRRQTFPIPYKKTLLQQKISHITEMTTGEVHFWHKYEIFLYLKAARSAVKVGMRNFKAR